jgi:adenylate cyclase
MPSSIDRHDAGQSGSFRIFVSYARPNAATAKRVVDALTDEGYDVWWDDHLPAHRAFHDVIDERLQSAHAVVALWSADGSKSDWVRAEADFGRTHGKLLQATLDDGLPPMPFNQLQCVKLADWRGDAGHPEWQKLLAGLRAVTTHDVDSPSPTSPPHRRRWKWGAWPAALIALVVAVAIVYFSVDRPGLQPPATTPKMPSVAVLPFKSIGDDPTNAVLADGVADTLLTMLAQIRELRVIARTSSFSFRGKEVDLRTIGEALGADAILEGSMQRSSEKIRINAQLSSAVDGVHLWAENFERPVSDIFAVQDEIARRVAEALKVTLAGNVGPGSVGTQSFEAYELALEAKQLVQSRQSANRERAIPLLERAVQLDPNYGAAWVGLFYAYPSDSDAAKAALERALEVAPNTSGPHIARGIALMYRGDPGAAAEMARGLELAPQDPFVLSSVAAEYRMGSERYQEAAALMRRAVILDPRSTTAHFGAALAFEANDDRDGALAEIREVLRLDPNMVQAYYAGGGILYGSLGRMDEALRFLRRARAIDPNEPSEELVLGYALIGEHEQAVRELEAQRDIMDDDSFLMLRARIDLLGGHDAAPHELLARAFTADPARSLLLNAVDELALATTQDNAQRVLARVNTDLEDYPMVCTAAWSGDSATAATLLTRWEEHWRSHLPYSFGTGNQRVGTSLARALACTGRNAEALAELERIVAWGYHAGGWRGLAADRAYDGLRADSRFEALTDRLKTVSDAERRRFLSRPDLEDADIDALVD